MEAAKGGVSGAGAASIDASGPPPMAMSSSSDAAKAWVAGPAAATSPADAIVGVIERSFDDLQRQSGADRRQCLGGQPSVRGLGVAKHHSPEGDGLVRSDPGPRHHGQRSPSDLGNRAEQRVDPGRPHGRRGRRLALWRVGRGTLFPTIRPKDAATLILIDRSGRAPKVLLGKRHERHSFMPGKFVFPGGRIDPSDRRMPFAGCLAAAIEDKLLKRVSGATPSRPRALALAAS